MKTRLRFLLVFGLAVSSFLSSYSQLSTNDIQNNIAGLPVIFRGNEGQWNDKIVFRGQSPAWDAGVSFLKDGVSFGFVKEEHDRFSDNKPRYKTLVWNTRFLGADQNVNVTADGKQNSKTNYLIGNDFTKHVTNVSDYSIIRYKNIYPGIDINYYGTTAGLKYDYVIKPGATLNTIRIRFEGVNKLEVNPAGQLEISTAWGTLTEEMPESYQVIGGERVLVNVAYQLEDDSTVIFIAPEGYNSSNELIIDPLALQWSTYCGGTTQYTTGYLYDMAVDPNEDVYITGHYYGDLPIVPGSYDSSFNGPGVDTYVTKLNNTGTALYYCTYVGDSGDEFGGYGIDVNAAGEAFVVGNTGSALFPVTGGSYDAVFTAPYQGYVFKLNAAGSGFVYSTFLGETGTTPLSIDVNAADEAFILGTTNSATFPVTGGVVQSGITGSYDYFVTKLNAAGSAVMLSTFVGGSAQEGTVATSYTGYSKIVVNAANEPYISGSTSSNNFPTVAAYDATYNGGGGFGIDDGILFKLNSAFTALQFSTYIGSTGDESVNGIALGPGGEIYLSGFTSSTTGFPIVGGFQTAYGGGLADAFLMKMNSTASAIVYSSFLGGSNSDYGHGIAVNGAGEAVIAGYTSSSDFPTTTCAYDRAISIGSDMFFSKTNAAGSSLVISSYIGGNENDYSRTKVHFVGQPCDEQLIMSVTTHSFDYPTTTGAFQTTKLNNGFGFGGVSKDQPAVTRLKSTLTAGFTTSAGACGTTVAFTDTTKDCGLFGPITIRNWDFGDGGNSTLLNPSHTYASAGTYTVTLIVGCPRDTVQKVLTVGGGGMTLTATPTNATCSAAGSATANLTGGASPTYTWSTTPVQNTVTATNLTAGTYTVTVNSGGCTITTTATVANTGTPPSLTMSSTPVTCSGQGTAAVTPAPAGAYTYSWSTTSTAQSISNLAAGTYTVTVRDGSCTTTGTVAVTQTGSSFTVTATSTPANCSGAGGTATATVTGGTAPTYLWSNTQTTSTINNLSAATYTVTVTDGGCTSVSTVAVTQTGIVFTVAMSSTPADCSGGGGTATATVTGGTAPTYLWSNTQTTSAINSLGVATYTVTVTDGGCSSVSTVSVTQTGITFTLAMSSSPSNCSGAGGSATATVTGGTAPTYLWSDAQTTQTASNLSAATYTVTVTDGGCSSVSTVSVTQTGAVTLSTSSTPAGCLGNDGTATATVTGGTVPTYTWSNSQSTAAITALSPATYTVTVNDGSCSAISTVSVTQTGVNFTLAMSSNPASCSGSTGSATATPSAVGTYNYLWSNAATGQTASALGAATYTVSVTDGGGCMVVSTVSVTQVGTLSMTLSSTSSVCTADNGTATVNATGTATIVYTWSTTPVQNAATASNLAPATYTVTVTDGSGCSLVSTASVTQTASAITLAVAATPSSCGSNNGTASITPANGSGTYTYIWSNAQTIQNLNNLAAATYSVTVSDSQGCTAFSTASVGTTGGISVSVTRADAKCAQPNGQALAIVTGGSGTYTYVWSNAATGRTATNLAPGGYTVTVTDGSCAPATALTFIGNTVNAPFADFDLNPQSASVIDATIHFTDKSFNAVNWFWDFNDPSDNTSSTNQNPTHTYSDSGTYCIDLIATDVDGCVDTANKCVVIEPEFTLYIPNAFSPNGDNMNEKFLPQGVGITKFEMWVFDRWGNLIFVSKDLYEGWDGRANNGTDIAQQDVYVYVLKVDDIFKVRHRYVGDVTLVK